MVSETGFVLHQSVLRVGDAETDSAQTCESALQATNGSADRQPYPLAPKNRLEGVLGRFAGIRGFCGRGG